MRRSRRTQRSRGQGMRADWSVQFTRILYHGGVACQGQVIEWLIFEGEWGILRGEWRWAERLKGQTAEDAGPRARRALCIKDLTWNEKWNSVSWRRLTEGEDCPAGGKEVFVGEAFSCQGGRISARVTRGRVPQELPGCGLRTLVRLRSPQAFGGCSAHILKGLHGYSL
jgi:hypothetical protein